METKSITGEEEDRGRRLVYYAVLRIDWKMRVGDEEVSLLPGEYVIPVFEDYGKACEYSQDGKFEILTLTGL